MSIGELVTIKLTHPFIKGINHSAMTAPPGQEEKARSFYSGLLKMEEGAIPAHLGNLQGQVKTGLIWFVFNDAMIHIVFDEAHTPIPAGRHLCFQINDLTALHQLLTTHGHVPFGEEKLSDRERFFVKDPFDNCLEFLEFQQANA
ncbi:MAG: glyoxalase [Synechococcus sp. BS307-5m-G39]|nr:glyoxalase [Synechococcus sp. BS307-5m-G39]